MSPKETLADQTGNETRPFRSERCGQHLARAVIGDLGQRDEDCSGLVKRGDRGVNFFRVMRLRHPKRYVAFLGPIGSFFVCSSASVGKMEIESLSLFNALVLAFVVSLLSLLTQVVFRSHERKQLARQALIDRVYVELSVAEGVMYRVRIALARTAANQCKLNRFEAEDYIFGPILAESRITSLDLDLKQKSVDASDLVIAIHTHRKFCIEFLLKFEPNDIKLENRSFLAPMLETEWRKLHEAAYGVIQRISKL